MTFQNHSSTSFFSFLHTVFLIAVVLLSACSTQENEKYYRLSSSQVNQSLLEVFRSIHSLSEAKEKSDEMERLFVQLAQIMIAANRYQEKHTLFWELSDHERERSNAMQKEIERLIAIPGVEDVIQKAQDRGFRRLESYVHLKEKRIKNM